MRRTPAVRALGAPRAHVLHARALRRHAALPHSTRPDPGSLCIAEPRTSRPPAPRSLWRPAAPLAAPLAARRRRQRIPPRTAPPKPPAHASCLRAQAVLILPLVGTRSSPPRCPATRGKRSPAILSAAAAEPASSRYIKGPQAPPSTHATSDTPRRASRVVNRPVVAVSLNSGQPGRRQAPVRFVATGHPLAQPAPPVAPFGPCGAAQLLIFDQRPPEHKKHFTTVAFPRRGARRRRFLPPPTTLQPPKGPPRSSRSIPARRCPRGVAVRRRRSQEPRSRRAEEKRRREGTVKPDQWALWTHCQRPAQRPLSV